MITKQDKDLAQWVLKQTLKEGAQQCRVCFSTELSNSFEFRNTELDNLKQATSYGLEIEVFANSRYASFSTNRLERNSLEQFIKQAIAATLALDADKERQLPAVERYAKNNQSNFEQYDSNFDELSSDIKIDTLKHVAQEAQDQDKRVTSISAFFNDSKSNFYLLSSNGFEGEQINSNYSLSSSVTIKGDGDARPSGSWYESSPIWKQLTKKDIATTALQRAQSRIGQNKMKSGTYPMLIDNRLVTRILSPLISALYGSSLQQKNSFLLNKLNQKVISDIITISDKPHTIGSNGSRWFDREGVATVDRVLFDKGVLNSYFINTYYAAKLQIAPTISSPSVLCFNLGTKSQAQLISNLNNAIVVSGFNGGNTNTSTGDFSFGIEGFWVENGQIKQAINEMNITGNILDLWSKVLEVGNNPNTISAWQTPSILFDQVSFSGL